MARLASVLKVSVLLGAAWGMEDGTCNDEQCDTSALLQSNLATKSKVDESEVEATTAALQVLRDAACRQWAQTGDEAEFMKNCEGKEVEIHTHADAGSGPGYHKYHKYHQYHGPSPPSYDDPQPSWPEGCEGYCDYFVPSCSAPNNPIGRYYKDKAQCLELCAKIPVTHPEVQQGNTMACRAFHAALSQSTTAQTAFHCNHAFHQDPMHICRNAPLPRWKGQDQREIVFNAFGPYPIGKSLLQTDLDDEGKFDVCKACNCNKDLTVVSCQGRGVTQSQFEKIMKYIRPSVQVLDLSANAIEELPDDIFKRTPGLLGLDLANNNISKIEPDAFKGLKILVSLLLDYNNPLTALPAGMLDDQTSLVEFSITNCGLSGDNAFPAGIFMKTRKLQFASLFGNGGLTSIPKQMFRNTPDLFLLSLVVTGQDSATGWPEGVLDGLDNLEQLHIALNGPPCNYDSVPTAVRTGLKTMKKLQGFVLWGCDTLTALPPKMFAHNPNLEVVYFFNSGIQKFDKDLLSATNGNLKILGVDSNNVTYTCAYAASTQGALYPTSVAGFGTGTALADEVGFVCDNVCADVCPMVRTAKKQNPGAYVTFGNFIPQITSPLRR